VNFYFYFEKQTHASMFALVLHEMMPREVIPRALLLDFLKQNFKMKVENAKASFGC
jgi:hypothetical protein